MSLGLVSLNSDIYQIITDKLPLKCIKKLSLVCKRFWEITRRFYVVSRFCWHGNVFLENLWWINNIRMIYLRSPPQYISRIFPLIREGITHIDFSFYFNETIEKFSFPISLTHLKFGHDFNQPISSFVSLKNLTHLTFDVEFNQYLDSSLLPPKLKYLKFGHSFNQILHMRYLPQSLESLTFGYKFNQYIDTPSLPKSLKCITFGYKFNQHLVIPDHIIVRFRHI